MIAMIFAAVAFICGMFVAYLAGKDIGRENGYYEGRSEARRDLEHIVEHYKKMAYAKDTPTKGA
jgi:membrane protein DedA with SNARE-associated domain